MILSESINRSFVTEDMSLRLKKEMFRIQINKKGHFGSRHIKKSGKHPTKGESRLSIMNENIFFHLKYIHF